MARGAEDVRCLCASRVREEGPLDVAARVEEVLRGEFERAARRAGRDGVVTRTAALESVRDVVQADALDEEALARLCPRQMDGSDSAERLLTFADYRDLVHAAATWIILGERDFVNFERRWTALSDPEHHYTLDFPLRRRTRDKSRDPLDDLNDGDVLEENHVRSNRVYSYGDNRSAMFMDRVHRLKGTAEADLQNAVHDRILNFAERSRLLERTTMGQRYRYATGRAIMDVREGPIGANDVVSHPQEQVLKSNLKSFLDSALDITKSLAAGAVAGSVAKTLIAPLDRTKIIFQTSEDKKFTVRAVLQEMRKIVRSEGVSGLWRGHSATLSRVAPYAAIQFVSFDFYKSQLLRENDKNLTPLRRLLAGSLAGATSVVVTYPLDLMRARMAVQYAAQGGIRHNFRDLYQREGFSGMYKGLGPTLFGIVPYAGLAFGSFETFKMIVSQHYGSETVTPGQRLVCGALAGFVAQSLTYPLDIVRRRMQTDGLHLETIAKSRFEDPTGFQGNRRRYHSIFQTLTDVARKEGVVGGLFKGLSMNWVKGPIAHAISFSTFDLMKKTLEVQGKRN